MMGKAQISAERVTIMTKRVLLYLAGLVSGMIVLGAALLSLWFASTASNHRRVDLSTTGYRLGNGNVFLHVETYSPDGISPRPFAACLVVNEELQLLGALRLPPVLADSDELIIEASSDRAQIQVYSPDSHVAMRWSNAFRSFAVVSNAMEDPLPGPQRILRRLQMHDR